MNRTNLPLINKPALLLVLLSLIINSLFLYLYNPRVFFTITQAHGHIGYNLYKNQPLKLNPQLTEHIHALMEQEKELIDFDRVRDLTFGVPDQPFLINDTIGYGVLLGLLWKLTHSLKFRDVQILQILIFSLLMFFFFQLAYLLFGSVQVAFCCGIAQLLFFPLIAYNVMPVRDIWAYYGLLMLCYAALAYMRERLSIVGLVGCLLFVAVCHWMRPTLFLAVVLMSLFFVAYAMRYRGQLKRAVSLLALLWLVVGVCFWLPFWTFNKATYGRAVVSPAGQSMLEGLGEIENPWGHELCDEYVNRFIGAKYGLQYGTPVFDDAAMQEFRTCVRQNPWHYIKTLMYRLPDALLPGLQWIFYVQSPYAGCAGVHAKLACAFSSVSNAVLFLLRQLYMRLYLLLGYIGMVVLWRRKQRFTVLFVVCCILLSGLSTYPSHIEYRYIVPFYWGFSFFVGPLCGYVWLFAYPKK